MELEAYFEFLSPDDIRIKGHRIGIDDVLYYHLDGYTPEEIVVRFPTLSLEEVYATITYYLRNRDEVDAYLMRLAAWREQHYRDWSANSPPVSQRLRALKAQRQREHALGL